jgi:hypothetical protein
LRNYQIGLTHKTLKLFRIEFGVVLAAAFTYVFALPANSDYWRMEIYKRGGTAWANVQSC